MGTLDSDGAERRPQVHWAPAQPQPLHWACGPQSSPGKGGRWQHPPHPRPEQEERKPRALDLRAAGSAQRPLSGLTAAPPPTSTAYQRPSWRPEFAEFPLPLPQRLGLLPPLQQGPSVSGGKAPSYQSVLVGGSRTTYKDSPIIVKAPHIALHFRSLRPEGGHWPERHRFGGGF